MKQVFKHQVIRRVEGNKVTWSFIPPSIKYGKGKMSEGVKHVPEITWTGVVEEDFKVVSYTGSSVTDEVGRTWVLNFVTDEVVCTGKESIIDSLKKIAIRVIQSHTSVKNALSMEDFALAIGTSTRQLRLVVAELRRYNPFGEYFLVSDHANGYWLSKDVEEIDSWISGSQSAAKSLFKTLSSAAKLASHKKQKELYGDLYEFQEEMKEIASENVVSETTE